MNNEKVKDYIKKQNSITLPDIQNMFSLSYNQAKAVVDSLVEDDKLVYDSGITYTVKAEKPKKKTPVSRPSDGAELISNRYRQLRDSLFKIDDPDDDDDDDDDETDYDEVIEALESVGEEAPDDTEDKESNNSSRFSLSQYFEVMKFKRLFSENLGDVIQQKTVNNEQCSVLNLGLTRCFKLSFAEDEDYVKISDCGNTISEDSKNLNKALEIIHSYENIKYEYGEIIVTVHRSGDVLTALLELFAATERIKHIQ